MEDLTPYENPIPPEHLRRIRTVRLGVTQARFAELLGVCQRTVSRWELGISECSGPCARLIWTLLNAPGYRHTLETMAALDAQATKNIQPRQPEGSFLKETT